MPHIRFAAPIAFLAVACLSASVASAAEPTPGESLVAQIIDARLETRHWQRVMQRPRRTPRVRGSELSYTTTEFQERSLDRWTTRAERARENAIDPTHERAFRCIHRHEGPWDANTGNGYYGGLQMDMTFQQQYGTPHFRRKGTANNWTPLEQIWTGERAHREGLGFHPWPTAARRCGLI